MVVSCSLCIALFDMLRSGIKPGYCGIVQKKKGAKESRIQDPFMIPIPIHTLLPFPSPEKRILLNRVSRTGSVVGRRLDMACPRSGVTATTTSLAAGEAGDDDIEERGNGSDDGREDTCDTVDNGHETSSNGLEEGLDLWGFY